MSLVEVRTDLTNGQFQDALQDLTVTKKKRLVELCGYEVNGQAHYSAIWEPPRGVEPVDEYYVEQAMEVDDYFQSNDLWWIQGRRPVRLSGYSVGEKTFIATIWARGPGLDSHTDLTQHPNILNLPQHLRNVRLQGDRITDISCYTTWEPNPDHVGPGPAPSVWVTHFVTIWAPSDGRDWDVSLPADSDGYQTEFNRQHDLGRFPVRVSGFNLGGKQKFVALFEELQGKSRQARHARTPANYDLDRFQFDNYKWRQIAVGGYSVGHGTGAVPRFNPIWEYRDADTLIPGLATTFMRDFAIPGLSLAVAKDGRLVYAAGFGLADKTTGTHVTPSSPFRIASVSKPITAVALMRLAAEGKISPNEDRVFGPGGRLSGLGAPADSRADQISVRHLMEHSCGGWSNEAPNDPMYAKPELSARELITDVLTHRLLDHDPGTVYAYSNFGYCVLGRIIEEVTGQTYEEYVRQNVLLPCGVQDMFIAGNTARDKRPGEVTYYGLDGGDPYGLPIHRMDAHGGWLATPTDLLRFAVRVDGFPLPTDLLPAERITYITTPSGLPGSGGYAKGWFVGSDGTWWHDGFLEGTASILVRTADGYCWAAVANSGRRGSTTKGLDDLMWRIHDRVDVWPTNEPL
ncbi:serine hydrolase [Streptomyces sp. NPDC029006]|uniref:serine hydrolase n=1 Tax=Streptomyces sp. NPDC029006 TaxID=3155467 RepID=UPI0034028AAE